MGNPIFLIKTTRKRQETRLSKKFYFVYMSCVYATLLYATDYVKSFDKHNFNVCTRAWKFYSCSYKGVSKLKHCQIVLIFVLIDN